MLSVDPIRRHWQLTQRITAGVLGVWFAVSFGIAYFGRELSGKLLGWPFSFWVAAQGAALVYLALVCLYAWLARRLDEDCDLAEAD